MWRRVVWWINSGILEKPADSISIIYPECFSETSGTNLLFCVPKDRSLDATALAWNLREIRFKGRKKSYNLRLSGEHEWIMKNVKSFWTSQASSQWRSRRSDALRVGRFGIWTPVEQDFFTLPSTDRRVTDTARCVVGTAVPATGLRCRVRLWQPTQFYSRG